MRTQRNEKSAFEPRGLLALFLSLQGLRERGTLATHKTAVLLRRAGPSRLVRKPGQPTLSQRTRLEVPPKQEVGPRQGMPHKCTSASGPAIPQVPHTVCFRHLAGSQGFSQNLAYSDSVTRPWPTQARTLIPHWRAATGLSPLPCVP